MSELVVNPEEQWLILLCCFLGEALGSAGVKIQHVYTSPSFRCVQTVTGILKGRVSFCS